MVILVAFNSFNVVKNLKKPDLVAYQKPPFYTLAKLLNKGFFSVFWNEYKIKIEAHTADNNIPKRILLDSSFQGVNRLFVMAYANGGDKPINMDSHRRYALPRVNLTKFNILIDGRNFYDQPFQMK